MATLSELQATRDLLLQRRHSGIARVSVSGKTVEYRSQAEIDRALDAIDREIDAASGNKPVKAVRITGSKGL